MNLPQNSRGLGWLTRSTQGDGVRDGSGLGALQEQEGQATRSARRTWHVLRATEGLPIAGPFAGQESPCAARDRPCRMSFCEEGQRWSRTPGGEGGRDTWQTSHKQAEAQGSMAQDAGDTAGAAQW